MKNSVIQTTINKLRDGDKFGSVLVKGFSIGVSQALTGGFMGGISGGIRAKGYGGDFWTGKSQGFSLNGGLGLTAKNIRPRLSNKGGVSNITSLESNKILSYDQPLMRSEGLLYLFSEKYDGSMEYIRGFGAISNSGSEILYGGRTPFGHWQVTDIYTGELTKPFKKNGVGFAAQLKALFSLPDARGAGTFYIHPDGNKVGTLGCIGLTGDKNSLNWFSTFITRYLKNNEFIELNVQ